MEKKTKEIKLPMDFNPGTQKYEPILPLRKTREKVKIDIKPIIILIIALLILFGGFLLALKYNLFN